VSFSRLSQFFDFHHAGIPSRIRLIAAARDKDDAIYAKEKEYEKKGLDMKSDYDLKIMEANYKMQLNPLDKAVKKFEKPEPEPKKKTTRGRSPKQKRREEVLKEHEREIGRIEAMKGAAKAKATLTKAAEAEKEVELEKIEKMP
jgi:plasmid maintenance system killer protein